MQRDLLRLGHILDAGEAIVEGVQGITVPGFPSKPRALWSRFWPQNREVGVHPGRARGDRSAFLTALDALGRDRGQD